MKSFVFGKLLAFCLMIIALLVGATACNNEGIDPVPAAEQQDSMFCYESSITTKEYNDITNQIHNAIKYSTRATGEELTEEEARIVLKPFIKDGLQLQNQILLQQNELGLSATEVSEIENMTEDQLAELSFTFQTIYNSAATTQSISGQDFLYCLAVALGFDSIESFVRSRMQPGLSDIIQGTKALITAQGAKQIVCALAKRTLGWIGVAYTIYEFGNCLKNKQQGI